MSVKFFIISALVYSVSGQQGNNNNVELSAPVVVEIAEGKTHTLRCNVPGQTVNIASAAFVESYKRKKNQCILPESFCQGADVLDLVASSCYDKTECQLWSTKQDLINPCPKQAPMRLIVAYACLPQGTLEKGPAPDCSGKYAQSRFCG